MSWREFGRRGSGHADKTRSIDKTYNMYIFLNRLDNKRLKKIALELMSTVDG